mgnify:CR=1 FL=1
MFDNSVIFETIIEDFSKVRVYKNINPSSIAKKYNINHTQNPIKKNDKYYLGFVENTKKENNEQLIPYYIFQTWKTHELEDDFYTSVKKWFQINPEYSYFLFDDVDIEKFIELEYGSNILELYKRLAVGAAKADFLSLSKVWTHSSCTWRKKLRKRACSQEFLPPGLRRRN